MLRFSVAGASGKMGRMIVAALHGREGGKLTAAFEKAGSPAIGQDAGILAGIGAVGVKVGEGPTESLTAADVLIDFTDPDATVRHAQRCAESKVAMIIGTTGLDAAQKEIIRKAAARIPVVLSPNMSVGVNLTFKIIEEIAKVLGPDFDVEIIEAHHRLKKDAPSGTAARLLEILAEAKDLNPEQAGIHGRRGLIGPRPDAEIGVHAVRAGDIVGDHTILFAGPGERVEITHRAHSRETFARGAARAAFWIAGRPPGMYDMFDVLGLR